MLPNRTFENDGTLRHRGIESEVLDHDHRVEPLGREERLRDNTRDAATHVQRVRELDISGRRYWRAAASHDQANGLCRSRIGGDRAVDRADDSHRCLGRARQTGIKTGGAGDAL